MANSKEILTELLKLPASERARIAAELVHSLERPADTEAAEAWAEQVELQVMEVEASDMPDWTGVRGNIESRLIRAMK
jgi:hypothetical protein